jgi:ABC-type antimicrobial peptide transport system permease subunit
VLRLEPMLAAARQGPVALTTAATADALLGETVRTQRFQTWLFSAFAGGALAVLCVGVLGLVAITAGRRTREFAIRLALGAGRGSLVGLMLREQVPPVALGLAAGGLLSIWVARSLRSYLHETPPFDVTIWTIAMLAIIVVTVSGILIPARRAARLDPARSLRAD